jgi:hypothetical protein
MGFKSRRAPRIEVRQVMNGKDCLLFSAKKQRKERLTKKTEIGAQSSQYCPTPTLPSIGLAESCKI